MAIEESHDEWSPLPKAIYRRVWNEREDAPGILVLSHHSTPYYVSRSAPPQREDLREIAYAYLERIKSYLPAEVPEDWIPALKPPPSGNAAATEAGRFFGWIPFDDRSGASINHLSSTEAVALDDHLTVLLASQCLGEGLFLGSGFGLRVAVHWRETDRNEYRIAIAGLSASLPYGPYLAYPPYPKMMLSGDPRAEAIDAFGTERLATMAGLDPKRIWLKGLRMGFPDGAPFVIERRCVGTRVEGVGVGRPYFASTVTVGSAKKPVAETLEHMSLLISDADGCADVFVHAPAPGRSTRPRRDQKTLQVFRKEVELEAGTSPVLLRDDDGRVQVLPSERFVLADKGIPAPLPVPAPCIQGLPQIRSNAASAIQPFWHACDLFSRMEAYGFDLDKYFQLINKEVDIDYRSGVSPGPGKDGQSINAQVLPKGWPSRLSLLDRANKSDLPKVQIRLSLGDQARRDRKARVFGSPRTQVEPLGIGADPHWMWHEFGHLLTLASTGYLELRFAHSPGDALAAIVADPELEAVPANGKWRGATFPWVFLPRRHDRCASVGWSWCGTMHRELGESDPNLHPRRKGYRSEQILSSTLFRIYRCIGGDTNNPVDITTSQQKRREASHYTSYLIMRALQILGDDTALPTQMPEQFEACMMEADLFLGTWTAVYQADFVGASPENYARVGGCARKVIRWCFEAQGLHAPTTSFDSDGPGEAEQVDVFIASRRPWRDRSMAGAIAHGFGNYVPVSLHWKTASGQPKSRWQAHPTRGIVWNGAQKVRIYVGNRGTNKAENVKVYVWYTEWVDGDPPPEWKVGAGTPWKPLTAPGSPPTSIPSNRLVDFGAFGLPLLAQGRYVLLASASCPEDRPCVELANHAASFTDTPLEDLVAGDNNIGLLVIRVH